MERHHTAKGQVSRLQRCRRLDGALEGSPDSDGRHASVRFTLTSAGVASERDSVGM